MVTVGFLVARLHLHVFDRIFLAQGRLARLLGRAAAANETPTADAATVTSTQQEPL